MARRRGYYSFEGQIDTPIIRSDILIKLRKNKTNYKAYGSTSDPDQTHQYIRDVDITLDYNNKGLFIDKLGKTIKIESNTLEFSNDYDEDDRIAKIFLFNKMSIINNIFNETFMMRGERYNVVGVTFVFSPEVHNVVEDFKKLYAFMVNMDIEHSDPEINETLVVPMREKMVAPFMSRMQMSSIRKT